MSLAGDARSEIAAMKRRARARFDRWAARLLDSRPGESSLAPALVGTGTLFPGDTMTLSLTNALENSTTNLVVGLFQLGAPFKGGTLVPYPNILLLGLPTDSAGSSPLVATWPGGMPSGVTNPALL